jgi:hypothetical protein
MPAKQIALETSGLRWVLSGEVDAPPGTTGITNRITGASLAPGGSVELAVVLSARPDGLAEPLTRVSDFVLAADPVTGAESAEAPSADLLLRSPSTGLEAQLRYRLDGPVRRKDALIRNTGHGDVLLLDIVLDDLRLEPATLSGGGQGQPVFIADELFAAVEHPSGWNETAGSALRLSHCPGRRLAPGDTLRSRTALFGAAPAGSARRAFVQWIQDRCLRLRRKTVSVYTPFGINNQWGLRSTLDDEQAMHVLDTLAGFRRRGVRFDFFTLDTGWVDYGSDLTRFRPVGFPEGPDRITETVGSLGMRFGLWFATSWASQSCWEHPPAWGERGVPELTWRNGYPAMTDYAASFCLAAPPYFEILRKAVLHHVRVTGARFLKFDGGTYACSDESHGHLPGKYAVELMHDMLIDLSAEIRAEAPDAFIMWYWGLRSPFWALHGDTIFESGLFMKGSGTSSFPALFYRDSVTLAQDQNACHAATIPPVAKDSLGVWLADTRWGNYMGRARWREALVMDLGRGNLLFPNLWGDIYLLEEDDVRFLAAMSRLARARQDILLSPRVTIGDVMSNEPYGYAYFRGRRGLVFLNNMHFAPREVSLDLGPGLGLRARAGSRLRIRSLFPERQRILGNDDRPARAGGTLRILLRPFEVLMLEVSALPGPDHGPVREARRAAGLGAALPLRPSAAAVDLDVRFADGERFSRKGHAQVVQAFETDLPRLDALEQPILCVSIRLRKDGADWRYSPTVCEIVQATARIGTERVLFEPVPDARQFGNTQQAGCSWVVYSTRMPRRWAGARLRLGVHAFLPAGVTAQVEAWVVRRWWSESARPVGDSSWADAPS